VHLHQIVPQTCFDAQVVNVSQIQLLFVQLTRHAILVLANVSMVRAAHNAPLRIKHVLPAKWLVLKPLLVFNVHCPWLHALNSQLVHLDTLFVALMPVAQPQ
jgi:hypothetical protein